MATTTATQVKTTQKPLQIGEAVKFALYFRPLVMVSGEVVEVIADGPDKSNWVYRVKYDFKGNTLRDLVDHLDPTLYLIG